MLRKTRGTAMAALGAGVFTCTLAWAQQAPQQDVVFVSRPMDSCGAGMVFDRPIGPGGPAGRGQAATPAVGAPYSGTGTTKVVRTLADGNRIVRTNTMRYARDGKGRTRTEYALAALGPFALEEARTLITIEDPVAQRRYVLNAEQRNATVFDTNHEQAMFSRMMKRRAEVAASGGGEAGEEATFGVISGATVSTSSSGTIAGTAIAGGGAAISFAGRPYMAAGTPMPLIAGCGPVGWQTRKMPPAVSLGERSVEGVKVIGSRHEFEIAAGEIGNEQPIRVRTEQWFSPDLGVVVESLHQDPMVGETSYKLTNIRRGEPDAALFTVPAGYTRHEVAAPRMELFEKPVPPPRPQ